VIEIEEEGIAYKGPLNAEVFPIVDPNWDGEYVVTLNADAHLLAASFRNETLIYHLKSDKVEAYGSRCLFAQGETVISLDDQKDLT